MEPQRPTEGVYPGLPCLLSPMRTPWLVAAVLCAHGAVQPPDTALATGEQPIEWGWAGKGPAVWPWFNSSLPLDERVERLVTAMTADELISQLVKYSQRIDRLGVPAYAWHMEAAHGVVTGGDSTSFPCSLARAAAFNPELEEQIAQVIGVEARAKWNDFIRLHGAPPPYDSEGLALTLYAPEINVSLRASQQAQPRCSLAGKHNTRARARACVCGVWCGGAWGVRACVCVRVCDGIAMPRPTLGTLPG